MTNDFDASASVPLRAPYSAQASIRLVEVGSAHDSALYNDAKTVLEDAIGVLAACKNVSVPAALYDNTMREALSFLSFADMADLIDGNLNGIREGQRALNRALDLLAASQIAGLVSYMLNINNPPQELIAEIVERFTKNIPVGSMKVWPDLADMALTFVKTGAVDG
ncbi:MAG: hypothetical protein A4S14_14635 [Proteobacteria bacterium SG_bin9]|nr:MAG: hypothetical protein A4S14_14635 [Proteobacteria bacterium SG_bin9]